MGSGNTKQQTNDHTLVPHIPNDYPHPKPSCKLKRDIVKEDELARAKERAESVPVNATKTYDALVSHLVGDATTDLEIAWSIYWWLGTLDPLEFGRYKPGDMPTGYMRIIRDNHGDMATFYAIICRRAGLKCVILEGVTKNEYYDVGQSELELTSARERWVAVYVSEGWRFVHVNIGIRSNAKVKFYFFVTDPEDMILTCYPDKPQWQLMTKKLKLKDFINLPYCTPHMLSLGLKLVEPRHGIMKSKSGKAFVNIAAPRSVSNKLITLYSLVGVEVLDKAIPLRTSTLINSTMTTDTIDSDSQGDFVSARTFPPMLDRYVFSSTRSGHFFFDVVLPIAGVYHFDIRGELVENVIEDRIEGLPLLCQLKMICLEAEFPAELDPLPASPIIGWGPGPLLSRFGMKPLSHREGHVYSQAEEEIVIKFSISYKLKFKIQLKHDILFIDDRKEHTEYKVVDGVFIVTLKLPSEGQYGLLIFAQRRNKNSVPSDFVNICNYLIITGRQALRTERFPKKVLRDRLDEQTTSGTCEGLQRALEAFLLHNVPDEGEVERAQDKLHFFQLQKNLKDTIKRRNIIVLQQSINQATTSRYQADLEEDIQRAEEYLKKLQKLSGFLHPISRMEPKVIAEIRSYKFPKPVVRDVLMATFILLGEKEEHVRDWGFIQYLLAKSGKDSLQKRIETFRANLVTEEAISSAHSILQRHNTIEAQGASNNAASFYTWAKQICEEKLSKQKEVEEKNKTKSKENTRKTFKQVPKEKIPMELDANWNQYKRPAIKPTDKCNRIYLEYLHTREKQRKVEL